MTKAADNYTIVFTDSGLGGLSIMADFYNTVKKKMFDVNHFNLIFFNALQENGNGYNNMPSITEKVATFNSALQTISCLYNPDQLAIACNTLSSVYPETAYARMHDNTLEIISCGRSLIGRYLELNPEIPVFILATPTTLDSRAYNFDSDNVFYISGGNLASLIEFNYMMPELIDKVDQMFSRIKNLLNGGKNLSLFFGCTHYAYITRLFRSRAEAFDLNLIQIIDPADEFSRRLLEMLPTSAKSQTKPGFSLKVESQAEILQEEITSISSMVQHKSKEIAALLKSYRRLDKTF